LEAVTRRFTDRNAAPTLGVRVAHTSVAPPEDVKRALGQEAGESDLVITSNGGVQRLGWLTERAWHLLILDEAQAIKNPGARQTRAVKESRLKRASRSRVLGHGHEIESTEVGRPRTKGPR
jgi:hypothetical protein